MIQHSHYSLLKHYFESSSKDTEKDPWVVAILVERDGSSYRRQGAFVIITPLGKSCGLLSGGCLEANIRLRARQALHAGRSHYVVYDMRDDDSYAAELGIGCKGKIGVLIQPISAECRSLLSILYEQLRCGKNCSLETIIPQEGFGERAHPLRLISDEAEVLAQIAFDSLHKESANLRQMEIPAPYDVWILGGGADAIPVARIASGLGWRVTIVDHRAGYAKVSSFPTSSKILRKPPQEIERTELSNADAAILMTHNLRMDADWLNQLQYSHVRYVGLLGPMHRRQQVLEMAEICVPNWIDTNLYGPAGLMLGGDLPESIALSILAECHACLYNANKQSLNLSETIHL